METGASESFLGFFRNLLTADFMPHGHCYWWRPEIVWLHVISDLLIGVAYFSIPVMVVYFVRKRGDVPFHWMFHLFAAFIFWCGVTHFLSIVTLWHPIYRFDGVIKAITAAISVTTAFFLFPLIPQALSLKSARVYEEKNLELEREIQHRQQLEDQLRRSNELLEERVRERTEALASSNRELEQFAFVASHDLKEPLRVVTLYVQMLSKRYRNALDSEADTYIGFVTEGTKRMQHLIDGILAYSRIGKLEADAHSVDMNVVAGHVMRNMQVLIEQRKARVQLDPLPQVFGDETELGQLLQNLLSNALKYNESNPPEVTITASKAEHGWTFDVKDNGIGIDPRFSDKVFQIFQRLHSAEKYSGTGIGLAICKKIVDRHRGRIWFDSVLGQGTTFHFTLPQGSLA